ncbi:type III effector HrpK domain-containing protein, partial [Trinickia diaoshuihuensis]|uniref:type III effector HrpK domain-containing protein n=1 Tax=Trinickia diaoshuihuensis TaxID=2292265 RepID=UPI001F080405
MSSSITSTLRLPAGTFSRLQDAGQQGSKGSTETDLLTELQTLLGELMHKQMHQFDTGGVGTTSTGTGSASGTNGAGAAGTSTMGYTRQLGTPDSSTNTGSDSYPELDGYASQADGADLGKWSDLAANDQGISLERPLAAMQILSGQPNANGQPPTQAQKQAAMQFVNDNPSLKSAMSNAGALNSDGSVDTKKLKGLLQSVEKNLTQADNNVKDYMKKHPGADPGSLSTVRSAALLQAYNPIAGESAGHVSNGKNNGYSGGKNGGGLTTKQQVADLEKNQGFSSALKSAAQAWSTNGAFDALDRAGDDKATTKADGKFDYNNLTDFISKEAPTNEASNQSFLEDASLQNITANTDTSKLNQDIFANPQNYTPEQKAAVMVTLMKTLVNVQAGGSDGLRDVKDTVAALQKDIQTLASDPATQAYLQQTVPPAMQNLGGAFAAAGGLPGAGDGRSETDSDGATGAAGSQSQTSAKDIVDQVHHGLKDAKTVTQTLSDLAKGKGFMGIGGDSAAAEAAGAAEGAVGGADGAAEGAAAGAEGAVAGAEG